METIAKVRRAHFVEGNGIKRICRETGLARETVRGIVRAGLDGPTERRYARREQPLPQIGARRSPRPVACGEREAAEARASDVPADL